MEMLIPTLAVVAAVLGPALPPSDVVMPRAVRPSFASVGFYDNLNEDANGKSVTNAVLDRSIRVKSVRVHMDAMDPESFTNADRIDAMRRNLMRTQQAYVEEHCHHRFKVEGLANATAECGEGKRGL